ncbi:FAS1-like dehydratase domain-containing protein [Microbacterium sp. gxy059]|uniref:Wt8.12 n=1 Tax=uncultured bacterium WT8 TaxID=1393214 RepID=U3Q0R5_9BACT|nr:Wt8.12 [uncultured bacterium WT8]
MSVDPDLASREFPPTPPYLVGREKVREFARAVFADAPQHVDVDAARAAGYADVVAPPTFAMVIADLTLQQLLGDPTTGVVLERALHVDQTFRYTRPIVAGDELTGRLRVTRVRAMGDGAMVTSETDVVDADGSPVVTTVSTLLIGSED